MKLQHYRYVIICPVRNEEKYISKTLSSVVSQTVKPTEMIVVDDGSTDGTCRCVEDFQKENPWIKMIHRKDRGSRKLGGVVVENFDLGLRAVEKKYEFIVKIDGDVSFPAFYFEELLSLFALNERLGIAGGKTYNIVNGRMVMENSSPEFDVPGPLKMYSKRCFEDIGGLIPVLGWDHIDQMKARMKGWDTKGFPELQIIHHRQMGASIGNLTKGKQRWGETAYVIHTHLLFVLAKGIYHLFRKPLVIGGLAFWYGYLMAALNRKDRYQETDVCSFMRKQQLRRLFGRKLFP